MGDIYPNLKYLASDPSSKLDNKIVDPVRNFLFGPPGAGGFDLASLNIQRGRDHGLADYNTVRAAYGLPKVTSFSQITSDTVLAGKLQQLYGNVNNIDAWVGALAEDHVPGTSTGALVRAALIDQFTRLRDGDAFWYQRQFSGQTLQALESTTLAKIIARNTDTTNLQSNVLFFKASVSGKAFNDSNGNGSQNRGEDGLGGRTVILLNTTENAAGEEIARTTTDRNGNYRFDNFDGLLVGTYRVQVVVPSGFHGTTPTAVSFSVTKGDTNRTVNFGLKRGWTGSLAMAPLNGVSGAGASFLAPQLASPVAPAGSTDPELPTTGSRSVLPPPAEATTVAADPTKDDEDDQALAGRNSHDGSGPVCDRPSQRMNVPLSRTGNRGSKDSRFRFPVRIALSP